MRSDENSNVKNQLWLRVAIFIVLAMLLVPQIWHRTIDRDEGFWMNTIRMVTHGQIPYQDFAFPQAPLHPYIYGFWLNLTGFSLTNARLFSVLLSFLLLLTLEGTARARQKESALLALLLIGLSSMLLNWHVPCKVHALYNFLVFGGWAAFDWTRRTKSMIPMFLSGLVLGLAFAVRITTLPFLVIPPFLLLFVRREKGFDWKLWLGGTVLYLGGFLVGFMPAITIYSISWPMGYVDAWKLHQGILGEMTIFGRFSVFYEMLTELPDALILYLLSLVGIIFMWVKKRDSRQLVAGPGLFLLLGTVVALAPGSASSQYFSTFMPFAALISASLLVYLLDRFAGWKKNILLIGVALLMVLGFFRFPLRVLNNGYEREQIGIAQVQAVSSTLSTLVPPGKPVLAYWPGYNALADLPCVVGTELGNFTMRLAASLPMEQWPVYHFTSNAVVEGMISRGEICAIVAGIDSPLDDSDKKAVARDDAFYERKEHFLQLLSAHYRSAGKVGGAEIFLLKDVQ